MPICSYLVVTRSGASAHVTRRLRELGGCEVVPAENRDVLILVTDTPGVEQENALRREVEALEGIEALLLTFGEIDPDAPIDDPLRVGEDGPFRASGRPRESRPPRASGPSLPVLGSTGPETAGR